MQIAERHRWELKVPMSQRIGDVRGFYPKRGTPRPAAVQRFEMAPVHAGKVD
jgi:hypothetical protein